MILGVVQGATEFLPVSSSAHLVLVPWLVGWPEPGLALTAILHWGTMFAVLLVFYRDWITILRESWCALRTRSLESANARLGLWIVIGSIPAGVVGLLFEDFFERLFGTPTVVAAFLLVTAALLISAERYGKLNRDSASLRWSDALLIGCAQAAAIAPGISRSGATIACALYLGLRRADAARFSFLLMTPAIMGAGLLSLSTLVRAGQIASSWPILLGGMLSAAISGTLAIHWLLRFVKRHKLTPFAVYCSAAGIAALILSVLRG
jgi:undecaprenyl-diphosphatase